jgi:hypothetical protein
MGKHFSKPFLKENPGFVTVLCRINGTFSSGT